MNKLEILNEILIDYLLNNRYDDEKELREDIKPYFNEQDLSLSVLEDITNEDNELYDYELLGEVKEENGDVVGHLNIYFAKTRANQMLVTELYLGEN